MIDWKELGEQFAELSELPRDERQRQLKLITNTELAAELSSLLDAHDKAEGFIESRMQRVFQSIAPSLARVSPIANLAPGERVLHFEILELLGSGSIAHVYLARDSELERLVALKVSLSETREARTLAHFSADGIIQVYSEHVVPRENVFLRITCLEYVAGPTLSALLKKIEPGSHWLKVLEQFPRPPVTLEPDALKWRERLNAASPSGALTLFMERLADTLAHAHARGVLHLDLKPANILIDPFGRPRLSDFNVSSKTESIAAGNRDGLGGTPYYMSPEQASIFDGGSPLLDQRCDVYSLGIVFRDWLKVSGIDDLDLNRVVTRATDPAQADRTPTASALSSELCTWRRAKESEAEMPALAPGLRWMTRKPGWALFTLTLSSQLVASTINIVYNKSQIASALTTAQNEVFMRCLAIYNVITYPTIALIGFALVWPLLKRVSDPERARRRAASIPLFLILLISIGWFPGGFIFPDAIDRAAGPLADDVYWHFVGSFSLGWLTSMTTSLAVSIFVLTRALYPRYWDGLSQTATGELNYIARINRILTFASALVPLAGVLLAVLISPAGEIDYASLRTLLIVVVTLGLANLLLIQRLTQSTEVSLAALMRVRA